MDQEEIEARLHQLELQQFAYKGLLSIVIAELVVKGDDVRDTLEDILAQAMEAREVHIPAHVGEIMPEVYGIMRDFIADVNKQLTKPLLPRSLPEKR